MRVSSMASRVVPAIGETMARSSFSKAFNRVNMPVEGRGNKAPLLDLEEDPDYEDFRLK
jgi:hypothetical protein